ncbi:HNH endonuclease [Kushneria sp. TE3]|uniref:HNH endonuclease n=1 Tax=Kushneria sp. TE3 TaxID=3449832 RepID=UPI003F686C3B
MDGWIEHVAEGPCIEHTGSYHYSGYGRVYRNGKSLGAHRVAYCRANGLEIEDISGKLVRHACDNPACVNPEHLSLGDHADNMMDKMHRGRCGSRPGSWIIFMQSPEGKRRTFLSQKEAAEAVGLAQPSISKLVKGGHVKASKMRGWVFLRAHKVVLGKGRA